MKSYTRETKDPTGFIFSIQKIIKTSTRGLKEISLRKGGESSKPAGTDNIPENMNLRINIHTCIYIYLFYF